MSIYKTNYDSVINTLNSGFHPLCGINCLYKSILFNGELMFPPRLVRCCNLNCQVCKQNSVAFPNFAACHKCATETKYPIEFNYYHDMCKIRAS